MLKTVKVADLKLNNHNPRDITPEMFGKLKQSIIDFPQMLETRPLVVDDDLVVVGGNMRLKALQELGFVEVLVHQVNDWSEDQKREFTIKDNLSYGNWDWEMIATEWDLAKLDDWGLDMPDWNPESLDYSILDEEEDLTQQMEEMTKGVKKAILIPFESEDYEAAFELIKFWRERGDYVGGMIMEFLQAERDKL